MPALAVTNLVSGRRRTVPARRAVVQPRNGVARVVDVVEQDRESVAAQSCEREPMASACHGVVGPKIRLQPARNLDEQAVGGGHAQAVIHGLEPVEPENHECELIVASSFGPADGAVEEIEKEHAIWESRQPIGQLGLRDVGQ